MVGVNELILASSLSWVDTNDLRDKDIILGALVATDGSVSCSSICSEEWRLWVN